MKLSTFSSPSTKFVEMVRTTTFGRKSFSSAYAELSFGKLTFSILQYEIHIELSKSKCAASGGGSCGATIGVQLFDYIIAIEPFGIPNFLKLRTVQSTLKRAFLFN